MSKNKRMKWQYGTRFNVSYNPFYQNIAKDMSVYQNDIEMEDIDRILECMQNFPMVDRLLEDIKNKKE